MVLLRSLPSYSTHTRRPPVVLLSPLSLFRPLVLVVRGALASFLPCLDDVYWSRIPRIPRAHSIALSAVWRKNNNRDSRISAKKKKRLRPLRRNKCLVRYRPLKTTRSRHTVAWQKAGNCSFFLPRSLPSRSESPGWPRPARLLMRLLPQRPGLGPRTASGSS